MQSPGRLRSCTQEIRGWGEEEEALQFPEGTPDPTEKVNVHLNHLHCSLTHIYTQPNAEILDKEGNEVERLLQEQNNSLALWPPMMLHVVAMEIWRRIFCCCCFGGPS